MKAFTVSTADIARCPKRSLSPRHYREDATCYCNEEGRAERLELLSRKGKLRTALADVNDRLREVEW